MFGREKEQGKDSFENKRTDEGQMVREVDIREDTTIPEIALSIIGICHSQNLKGTFSHKLLYNRKLF